MLPCLIKVKLSVFITKDIFYLISGEREREREREWKERRGKKHMLFFLKTNISIICLVFELSACLEWSAAIGHGNGCLSKWVPLGNFSFKGFSQFSTTIGATCLSECVCVCTWVHTHTHAFRGVWEWRWAGMVTVLWLFINQLRPPFSACFKGSRSEDASCLKICIHFHLQVSW